jgi:hypothetical protein
MIPLFNLDGNSTRPLGMAMCQNRLAVPTWSYAMEIHPPARVLEIGSYNGAERDPSVPQPERFWPWTEIRKADGDRVAEVSWLEPWLQEHFDQAGWLTYRKRPIGRSATSAAP